MTPIAKTTLEYKGVKYPFYKTNRGDWDWENAGFSQNDLMLGKSSAGIALVYFTVRDCAKRAGMPFTDSLEDFVDNTETDILTVFERIEAENKRIAKERLKNESELEKKSQPDERPEVRPMPR